MSPEGPVLPKHEEAISLVVLRGYHLAAYFTYYRWRATAPSCIEADIKQKHPCFSGVLTLPSAF